MKIRSEGLKVAIVGQFVGGATVPKLAAIYQVTQAAIENVLRARLRGGKKIPRAATKSVIGRGESVENAAVEPSNGTCPNESAGAKSESIEVPGPV